MSQRFSLFFIIATVVIDSMGIGLIMPVMPDLIREVQGGTLGDAAIWGGVLSTVFAVMLFLCGPVIGNLSDRYGRRPVLLVSLFAMALDYVVMALAGSIWLLLLGRIIGGITSATHSTASAYVADISAPHEKAARFGLIGAGFGVGFVLGPILGGVLAEFGTRAPFWAAAALAFGNMLLGFFVLRETVTDAIRRPFRWSRANPFGAFRSIAGFPALRGLLAVYFFYQLAMVVYPTVWAYFTTERFDWQPGMIGVSLAVYGVSLAVVQGLLVRPTIRAFGERTTVVLGLSIEIAGFLFLAMVTSGWLTLAFTPILALGAVGLPALQGIMSRNVSDDAQGELQGVLASATSATMIVGPLIMTQIFAYFVRPDSWSYLPGAPFLLSAVLMASALMIFATRYARRQMSS